MFKKILGMFVLISTMVASFSVCVNAASYWEEDFSSRGIEALYNITVPDSNSSITIEDGAIKVANNANSGNAVFWMDFSVTRETGEDLIFQYDVKAEYLKNKDAGSLNYIFVGHDRRRSSHTIRQNYAVYSEKSQFTDNTHGNSQDWFTYTFCFKEEMTKLDVYRKKAGTDDAEVLCAGNLTDIVGGDPRFSVVSFTGGGSIMHYDNFKCFTGTFAENGSFQMNGETIGTVNDITSGTLNVKADVILGKINAKTQGGVTSIQPKTVAPVMVAFDGDGKMMDCQMSSQTLNVGKNSLDMDFDTTAFGDSITDGYVGFYILEDMIGFRALVDPMELTAE